VLPSSVEAKPHCGVEALEGTYPFTLARDGAGYRINKFPHELIRRRDWHGLIRYGAIFFMLEKLGAVVGVSNLHIYAALRGQTLEEFQKTRNARGDRTGARQSRRTGAPRDPLPDARPSATSPATGTSRGSCCHS
jgi:gallate dioxygenase